MKNIVVVGCGYWGKNLVRNYQELGALYAICDTQEDRLKEFKAKYPYITTFVSYYEALQDQYVQGVVIASPAVYHYSMAKEALLAGKDVFVEKPLSLKVEEAQELVALAQAHSRILMVGHILQYHPAVKKLKELIKRGELGKMRYIYSNRLNIGKIRSEENILWSFAPHDISVILALLDEFPRSVSGRGHAYLQSAVSDVTLTTMDFASGAQAHIFVSWLHPFKDQKLVVVGDKKMAVFDDMAKEKLLLYPHRVDWINRSPVAVKAEPEVVALEPDEPLKLECQQFINSLTTRQQPLTDGQEGVRVLKVLNAFQESLNSGGVTVPLKKKGNGYFAHPTSFVDDGVKIGEGTSIWHFSHILKGSVLGKNCKIGQNVVVGPHTVVGNGCKIQNNVSVYEGVVLEDEVFCGPSMVFTNVFNPRSAIPRMNEIRKTLVKKGVSIGANATIICGHTIGRYAFIGAGAVVTKDVPDYALVVGNPGKITGWMCECGTKLALRVQSPKGKATCTACGKKYTKKSSVVTLTK